jgi:hypothetical protein
MERAVPPLAIVKAARAYLNQLDDTLAQVEARVRSWERVESIWRQATDPPRERREVCHGKAFAR